MKNITIFKKDNFIKFLSRFNEKLIENTHFNSLTPTDNADDCEVYLKSLEWALENRKTIKNIAIAGPHGSGKSSIIQTFIKQSVKSEKYFIRNFFPKYKFFNISLATFIDSQKKPEQTKEITDNDLQRLIELSILQQLFFHEEDSKIPDSRFKKIKRQKKSKLFGYSIAIIALLISSLFLLAPDFLAKYSLINISKSSTYLAHYIAVIITLIGLFLIIYKSSRSLIGLSIKKLNINNSAIEIDEEISKSILNNHLDEIIYFFEATKYSILVIEDLDRFGQTDVFTKLREINLLINNSNKIKRDVVFIYAIKDDMFLDKDRAKFFDFIIPIIPVINFSNSGDKIRKIVKQNNYRISEYLLDDLSMFIDDMRILYNIMNEYYIFSKKVDSNLNQNILLSIIVYKNIFPNDFMLLGQNEGDLYKTITKKNEYIKTKVSHLDDQISRIKEKIDQLEEQKIIDLRELRIIYISKVVEKVASKGFVGFNINNKILSISEYSKEEYFDNILKGSIIYYSRPYGNNEINTFTFKFVEIESEINKKLSYKDRVEIMLNKFKISELKKEIEVIYEQKSQVQKSKLKDLVFSKQILIETDSLKKIDLINILIRNGYIDENYMDYITIFHEGALTKSDYQFLINIKTEKQTAFDFIVIKTEDLIKKINEFAFEKEYVLNFNLVDKLLKISNQKSKKERLFQQLSNEKGITIEFIDKFIESTENLEIFISELCKYWTNIWNFINLKSLYVDEKKEKYFKLIIQHADVSTIAKIFESNKDQINNYSAFLKLSMDQGKIEKIIKTLDLKFSSIAIDSNKILLDYILTNNNYSLNPTMIRTLLIHKNIYNSESFEKMNYGFLLSTKLKPMIDYIESNIEEYVQNVYLSLDKNTEEETESYIKLINNEELKLELKEKIIKKVNTIIEEHSSIEDQATCNLMFKYFKISPTWINILESFKVEENKLNGDIISYLNSSKISEQLSRKQMGSDDPENKQVYTELCSAIIHQSEIKISSYKLITKSIPFWYESFEIDKLSKERIIILIENNDVNPTIKSYTFLAENFKGANVKLLEYYFDKFKDKLNQLSFDSDDLELILKSLKIKTQDKFIILNSCVDDIVIDNAESSKMVAQYIIDSDKYEARNSLKLSLFKNEDIPISIRIKLFNKYNSLANKNIIDQFLISLGSNYKEIADTSKKAKLDDNPLNATLLYNLVRKNYISSISKVKNVLRVNHKRIS
jgi:hypothetical protein